MLLLERSVLEVRDEGSSVTALRDIERASIRQFLTDHQHLLTGRVLDYGSGKQPYRDIVESAGGKYVPYDMTDFPGSVAENDRKLIWGNYDAIIASQCVQYMTELPSELEMMHALLRHRQGVLLMTGPTNWPIVEQDDLWRMTPSGVRLLLQEIGFSNIDVCERAHVDFQGERWCIGWQATASA